MQQNFECDKNTGVKQGIGSIIFTLLVAVCVPFFGDFVGEEIRLFNEAKNVIDKEEALYYLIYLNYGMWALAIAGVFAAITSIIAVVRFVQAIIYKCELPIASFVMGILCLIALIPSLIGAVEYIVLISPLLA